jgi:hypothetical protein
MTKLYCTRCKAYTDITNEDRDITTNGRYRLSGLCVKCEKVNCVFTNENYDFKRKSAKDASTARIKRKEASLNRKAKKLGRSILDADEEVQKCVRRCLKEV